MHYSPDAHALGVALVAMKSMGKPDYRPEAR